MFWLNFSLDLVTNIWFTYIQIQGSAHTSLFLLLNYVYVYQESGYL